MSIVFGFHWFKWWTKQFVFILICICLLWCLSIRSHLPSEKHFETVMNSSNKHRNEIMIYGQRYAHCCERSFVNRKAGQIKFELVIERTEVSMQRSNLCWKYSAIDFIFFSSFFSESLNATVCTRYSATVMAQPMHVLSIFCSLFAFYSLFGKSF